MSESVNFDRASEFYDATRGFPPGVDVQIAAFIKDVAELRATDNVLEIGIGTGRIALPLSKCVTRIIGVDISANMLSKLREKQTKEPIYLTLGDAHSLPFGDASFDAIVIVHVMHLVAEPFGVLKELARVLKPDGKLIHCRNKHTRDAVQVLIDAWREFYPNTKGNSDRWSHIQETVTQAGWKAIVEEQDITFTDSISPQRYLELIEQRTMSSLWKMSDDDHASAVASIRRAITEHFPNQSTVSLESDMAFGVRLWSPPER